MVIYTTGKASCFFLVGRSVGDGFGWTLGKGKAWALCGLTSSFPPTLISLFSFNLRGTALSKSHLSLWSWMGLSLWRPICPCWSLQAFKNSGLYISHSSSWNWCPTLLHLKHQPVKCPRCLSHSDSNFYITLKDCCIILHRLILLATVTLFAWKGVASPSPDPSSGAEATIQTAGVTGIMDFLLLKWKCVIAFGFKVKSWSS